MKKNNTNENVGAEQELMESIRFSRVIIPVVLGLGVVGYLLYSAITKEPLPKIDWTGFTIMMLALSVVLLGLRHFAYMVRLRILTDGFFSWKKCFELIFIWEFSSAITPTSVGGSAVAMFVLSQEKLPAGKIATIVFYSMVLDTLFFVVGLPLLFLFLGSQMIYPESGGDGFQFWRNWFYIAYVLMIIYGSVFLYGIIISPTKVKRFLTWICSFGFLKRFKEKAEGLGNDMVLAATEIKGKPLSFHLGAFGATATAWTIRFVLVMVLMMAFVPVVREGFSLFQQTLIYGRLEVMFVVLALSPTPGSSGVAEAAFGPFLSDFIVNADGKYLAGMAIIIAFLWRVLTYFFYLFAGAIVIPNWIRKLVNDRKKEKITTEK